MLVAWPLDENQGLGSQQHGGHDPWLMCEVALKAYYDLMIGISNS